MLLLMLMLVLVMKLVVFEVRYMVVLVVFCG